MLPKETHSMGVSRRQASLIGGISLLLMTVAAPIANFGSVMGLMAEGDPAATAANISGSMGMFGLGIFLFLVVALLDIIVAWSLYVLFVPTHRALSLLAAWFRLVYAAVLAAAINGLSQVLSLLKDPLFPWPGEDQLSIQVMFHLNSFLSGWDLGLFIFGAHLLVLGYLVFTSVDFPKFLGILVALAGLGYIIDSAGNILVPGYGLTIAMFTFLGEVLLIIWLLWKGIKGFGTDLES